jgi:hypothetical protein
MTLAPLTPSHLNSKKQVDTASPAFYSTPPTSNRMAQALVACDGEIDWNEDTSSPFLSELTADEKAATPLIVENNSPKKSPMRETLSQPQLSPSAQLKLDPTPFEICEDETSMPSPIGTVTEKSIMSPRKHILPDVFSAPVFQDESSELLGDTTYMTTNDDANIDDTCFSTFSEVPNADMTVFARLGQRSPLKQGFPFSQVCLPKYSGFKR